ncbi:MAG: hypothetical protein AAF730_14770 [Bacteroidota bacterium]
MMRILSFCLLALTLSCIQNEEARYLECVDAFSQEDAFDNILIDQWSVGAFPVWGTLDTLLSVYGIPSEVDTMRGDMMGYSFAAEGPARFHVIGDTLAYPRQLNLSLDTLFTPLGAFHKGTGANRIRDFFPKSYRCRDFPISAEWSGGLYDSQWSTWDSIRFARVDLFFREAKLVGIGVHPSVLEREAQNSRRDTR